MSDTLFWGISPDGLIQALVSAVTIIVSVLLARAEARREDRRTRDDVRRLEEANTIEHGTGPVLAFLAEESYRLQMIRVRGDLSILQHDLEVSKFWGPLFRVTRLLKEKAPGLTLAEANPLAASLVTELQAIRIALRDSPYSRTPPSLDANGKAIWPKEIEADIRATEEYLRKVTGVLIDFEHQVGNSASLTSLVARFQALLPTKPAGASIPAQTAEQGPALPTPTHGS